LSVPNRAHIPWGLVLHARPCVGRQGEASGRLLRLRVAPSRGEGVAGGVKHEEHARRRGHGGSESATDGGEVEGRDELQRGLGGDLALKDHRRRTRTVCTNRRPSPAPASSSPPLAARPRALWASPCASAAVPVVHPLSLFACAAPALPARVLFVALGKAHGPRHGLAQGGVQG
jgi:hypothetical protein